LLIVVMARGIIILEATYLSGFLGLLFRGVSI
jgi:hypothetical protein